MHNVSCRSCAVMEMLKKSVMYVQSCCQEIYCFFEAAGKVPIYGTYKA